MCFDCQDRKKYDVSIRPCIHHVTVAECMQGVPDVLICNKNVKFFHRHLETLPNCLRYLAVADSWKICRERYWGGLLIIFYINSTLSLLLMSGLITASPRPPPPEESYVGCLKSAPRSFHDFPNLMTKGEGLEHRTNGRWNSFACGSAFSSLNLSCCISAASASICLSISCSVFRIPPVIWDINSLCNPDGKTIFTIHYFPAIRKCALWKYTRIIL